MKRLASLIGILAMALPAQAQGVSYQPVITVYLDRIQTDGTFLVSGCGYRRLTQVAAIHDGVTVSVEVSPDQRGCVSATFQVFGEGDYLAEISEAKPGSGKWIVQATQDFTV